MTLLEYVQKKNSPVDLEVIGFQGPPILCERLHEMGLHCGQHIRFLGRAPLKGPLLIQFGMSFVALRSEEAECARIKPL